MEYSAIIVLANLMDADGVLNEESLARLDLAINEYKNGKAPLIITCGWDYRDDTSKKIADSMKDYAVNTGEIAPNCVFTELNSRDTVGDAVFTKKYFAIPKNLKSLLVVTSDYHTKRTREIFSFVYGSGYEVDIIGARTVYLEHREESESKSLLAFRETFKDLDPGNDLMISKCLFSRHPFYNGDVYPK